MKISKDGVFSGLKEGTKISLKHFEQRGDEFFPKMCVCIHREGQCKATPCGRMPKFKWHCKLLNQPCDMIVAGECSEPKH